MFIIIGNYEPFIKKFSEQTSNFIVCKDYFVVDNFIKTTNDENIILVNPFITLSENFFLLKDSNSFTKLF